MLIKRKRSDSELSFNPSFSSPSRPGTSAFDFGAMGPDNVRALSSRPSTPSHLHSRTMKRFRDNRPSEAEVHQRTLNLLYSAQQQHQSSCEAQPQTDMAMAAPPQPDTQGRREAHQRSLDSFWRLPVTAPSSAPSSPAAQQNVTPNCEDCGAGLGDGADMMMDVDGLDPKGRSCSACVKTVCFSCSISNLGDRRRCLACAERNVLVGSVGWTQVSAC